MSEPRGEAGAQAGRGWRGVVGASDAPAATAWGERAGGLGRRAGEMAGRRARKRRGKNSKLQCPMQLRRSKPRR